MPSDADLLVTEAHNHFGLKASAFPQLLGKAPAYSPETF